MSTDEEYVEIWGDRLSLRDLVVALVVVAVPTVAAVLVQQAVGGEPLFWGLGGAAVGFAVACLVVSPKRDVRIVATEGTGSATRADGNRPGGPRPGAPDATRPGAPDADPGAGI